MLSLGTTLESRPAENLSMLDLTDPLWKKLDAGCTHIDIAGSILQLYDAWDDELAKSLFWDCLCHQDTCYGATYAAVPHLLKIAEPDHNIHQRLEISLLLGYLPPNALVDRSLKSRVPEHASLRGLPQTLDAWDQKLDVFRDTVALLEDTNRRSSEYEQSVILPRYREILAMDPVNASDLETIGTIRKDFIRAIPEIRALCVRTYEENLKDESVLPYLLAGVAAADGLFDLAHLLNAGSEGCFACSVCGWTYEYATFGERIAVYADDQPPGVAYTKSASEDRGLQDYKEGTPSRSDGIVFAKSTSDLFPPDERIEILEELADKAASPKPAFLLQNFLGHFICVKCDSEASMADL